jgi:endoglucanase
MLRQVCGLHLRLSPIFSWVVVCVGIFTTLPARAADQRGRPHLNAARTSFVADNGQLLRGASIGTEYGGGPSVSDIQYSVSRGCNAIHLYTEDFVSGYAPGSMSNYVDQVVAMTRTNGLYLVMTIANSWANGSNSLSFATNFWKFYAPRYANETHVLYEIHNEPVAWGPPYSSPTANPPDALNMEEACYKIIRASAPNTPVLLFSYSVLGGSGGASAALTDIQAFNTVLERFR